MCWGVIPNQPLLTPAVTCQSDSQWDFELDIGFIDHLQVVNTNNPITNFHTLQITTAHAKSFRSAAVSAGCSMVTASNSRDSSTALNKSSLHRFPYKRPTSKLVLVITTQLGLHRKHCSLLYANHFHWNMFVCEGVAQ
jgi:hypothetical protein